MSKSISRPYRYHSFECQLQAFRRLQTRERVRLGGNLTSHHRLPVKFLERFDTGDAILVAAP